MVSREKRRQGGASAGREEIGEKKKIESASDNGARTVRGGVLRCDLLPVALRRRNTTYFFLNIHHVCECATRAVVRNMVAAGATDIFASVRTIFANTAAARLCMCERVCASVIPGATRTRARVLYRWRAVEGRAR